MKRYALCILALFLVGCATAGGRKIDSSAADKIKKGVSTKEDVVALLGKPQLESEHDGISIFTYIYQETQVQLNPLALVPINTLGMGASAQNSGTRKTDKLTVKFTPDGVVSDISRTKDNSNP